LVPVLPKFLRPEFSASRVFVIVTVDFCMTFKANGNRVLYAVVLALSARVDVVSLDLYSAEFVANAAPAVAFRQEFVNCVPRESLAHNAISLLGPAKSKQFLHVSPDVAGTVNKTAK
jgi:hypothetical protein